MENHSANYFTLLRYALYLNKALLPSFVSGIISVNKEEVLLTFSNQQYLKIYLGTESFIFQPSPTSIMPSGLHPFPEAEGLKVARIIAHTDDRSLRIELENNYTLVFNLYGRNGNIILFQNNTAVKLFKNHEKDRLRLLSDYNTVPQFSIESPAISPAIRTWIDSNETDSQTLLLESPLYISNQLENTSPAKPVLSLLPLEDGILVNNPEEALHQYAIRFFRWKVFNTLYDKILKKLTAGVKLFNQYCVSTKKQLESLEHEKDYRIQADLIMANLHQIPHHVNRVELIDFYSGLPVVVKLKENITPQKWAEKLYQKARNQEIEKNTALENLINNEEKLLTLNSYLDELNSITTYKPLKALASILLESEKEEVILPYRKFIFHGYEILVGKKSESNDRLTFATARKDDLFLHARDVPGSHVIIRNPTRKPIPTPVLEKAASLAAWYSKGKSSSLCPVSYTLRKYVRKPRNAAAGKVLIEKESVILVSPASFDN